MTKDLVALSDELASELVPMPPDAADVCPMCRSGRIHGEPLCSSCQRTSAQVQHPSPQIIPVSFYTTPSRLRDRMHDFTEHDDETVRAKESAAVASIITRYLAEHDTSLRKVVGDWDATVAIPSTRHDDPSALQTAIEDNFPTPYAPFIRPLTRGPGPIGHNQAAEDGFLIVDPAVADRNVLLIDDTLTTGARVHSAHHTLVTAGANVVTTVVVTRKINPSPEYGSQDLWDRQSSIAFDFTVRPWWAPSPSS